MSMPTPPEELVHWPPKRQLSRSPSPDFDFSYKRTRLHNVPYRSPHNEDEQKNIAKRHLSEDDRKRHALLFWQTMASISSNIPPGKAHLVQLQQSFIDSYFSIGVVSSHRQYFNIFYWMSPQSAAMNATRDALCMIHLGSRRRNFDLVRQGQTRYTVALHCLGQDLARPDAIEDDAVLGAIYTAGQLEVFMAVSRTNSQYATHMQGLKSLLHKRGPESMKSPFAQALLYNIRPLMVMQGLLSRQPQFLGEKPWRDAATKGWAGGVTISVELTDVSLRIADALQHADALSASKKKAAEGDIVDVLTELSKLENSIQRWLLCFYSLTRATGSPYRLSSITNYPFFRTGCGGLAHVFPSTIEFPSFISATTHMWVWVCLLKIRETILDVASLHPYPIVRAQNQEASLKARVDECADNLCQSIAYLIQPDHASCGMLACSPALHFSALWFERQGHVQRRLWARHVREFLQRDILLGGGYDTSINLTRPMFVWWMLPDIPADMVAAADAEERVVEETDDASG